MFYLLSSVDRDVYAMADWAAGYGVQQAEGVQLTSYDGGRDYYERGRDSPWYPWLNSLPRIYNTGASMTYACFDCLPPYAAYLALSERQNFVNFQKEIRKGPFSEEILKNVTVLKWAHNVALTRSIDVGNGNGGKRVIAPLADMFNHGLSCQSRP